MEISSVEELTNNLSFIRWAKGSGSPEEMKKWDRWVSASARNEQLARRAQQEVLGIDFVNTGSQELDLNREWDELEQRIDQKNSLKRYAVSSAQRRQRGSWYLKIAAAMLVAALAGVVSYNIVSNQKANSEQQAQLEWRTIETDFQQQKTIALSDGSTIRLNANSAITYPAGWVRGNLTEVYLEGEAYFTIVSRKEGNQPPFRVITDDGVVEVMGTRFVVATSEKDTRVGLEEGKVSIRKSSDAEGGDTESKEYIMQPNEMAQFSRDAQEVNISSHKNLDIYTSWIDQKLILDSSPLSYLIYRIEYTYGVDVVVNDEELYERKLTGTIQLKDLEYLTQSISEVMDEEVSLSDGKVYFGNLN
ncbi:FecR family protein [Halalkalibaculum sp. DA3122]|uniref:FecR family protein n=1 Tax=Halalkalibaculum sp. DA3122 TaxID=3373607 RepID=UPI00375489FC